jgi:hypothetical protein
VPFHVLNSAQSFGEFANLFARAAALPCNGTRYAIPQSTPEMLNCLNGKLGRNQKSGATFADRDDLPAVSDIDEIAYLHHQSLFFRIEPRRAAAASLFAALPDPSDEQRKGADAVKEEIAALIREDFPEWFHLFSPSV